MKEYLQNAMKNYKRTTSLAGIEDMNSRKLRDQEGHSPSGMKIIFLVTIMLVETLETNKFIVKHMKEITI